MVTVIVLVLTVYTLPTKLPVRLPPYVAVTTSHNVSVCIWEQYPSVILPTGAVIVTLPLAPCLYIFTIADSLSVVLLYTEKRTAL